MSFFGFVVSVASLGLGREGKKQGSARTPPLLEFKKKVEKRPHHVAIAAGSTDTGGDGFATLPASPMVRSNSLTDSPSAQNSATGKRGPSPPLLVKWRLVTRPSPPFLSWAETPEPRHPTPFQRPQKSLPQGSQEVSPEGQGHEAKAAFQFGPFFSRPVVFLFFVCEKEEK